MTTEYQPRYVAYAKAHGKTPEQMAKYDERKWAGGRMCGFILWIGKQWLAWGASVGGKPAILTDEHHAQFNVFIGA